MSYYDVLGLAREATPDDIKRAYRELAKKYHPDVYGGSARIAEQRMQEINEAYRVLSDEAARAKYDASLPKPKSAVQSEKPASGGRARRHPLERVLVLILIAVAVCAALYLILTSCNF